eukprot:2136132-Alexandrium_andersonii.AAC.1
MPTKGGHFREGSAGHCKKQSPAVPGCAAAPSGPRGPPGGATARSDPPDQRLRRPEAPGGL